MNSCWTLGKPMASLCTDHLVFSLDGLLKVLSKTGGDIVHFLMLFFQHRTGRRIGRRNTKSTRRRGRRKGWRRGRRRGRASRSPPGTRWMNWRRSLARPATLAQSPRRLITKSSKCHYNHVFHISCLSCLSDRCCVLVLDF